MDPENILAGTASLFLALGDRTRLRLLNLMRDREICVSSFTGTLGHSQPLISRHLAYLRNSGIVEARREGKWMHYSISSNLDSNTQKLLVELFRWMEGQEGLRADRENYIEAHPHAEPVVEKQKSRPKARRAPRTAAALVPEHPIEVTPETGPEEVALEEVYEVYETEEQSYRPVHHNELEDFLL